MLFLKIILNVSSSYQFYFSFCFFLYSSEHQVNEIFIFIYFILIVVDEYFVKVLRSLLSCIEKEQECISIFKGAV